MTCRGLGGGVMGPESALLLSLGPLLSLQALQHWHREDPQGASPLPTSHALFFRKG